MEEVRVDYSKYRMELAKECLDSSKDIFDLGHLAGSVNRSYYAIFNALRAVTILDGFDAKKHSSIISRFNYDYIRTGIFEAGTSKMIESAFKLRGDADYEDFYLVSKKDAQTQIENAEKIINMIQPYIESRWAKFLEEEKFFMNSIFTRVSTRNFESRKVESKYIIKILRAAMAAPSACNQQPWEFYVTEDKNIISRLSQVTPYAKPAGNAPVVIVPCINTEGLIVSEMAEIDMAIACENILLEAEELGLGAVMLGIAPFEDRIKAVNEILKLPEKFKAFTIIPVGYPVSKHTQEDRYEPSRVHVI